MKCLITEQQLKTLLCESTISDPERLTRFSKVVWSIVKERRKSKDENNRRDLRWSIYHMLQIWSNVPVSYISKNVADAFIYLKPDVDPFELTRSARYMFGRKKGKASFLLFEHTTPIGYFCDRILESESLDEVYTKMKYYTGVCIVTRPEDDCLNENFKSERPGRWRNSYKICKIHPLDPKEYQQYKEQKIGKFGENEKQILTYLYKDFFKDYY